LEIDFLRDEFVLIGNKLDDVDDHTKNIQKIISKRQSMDKIFKRVCIPVLLTYESNTIKRHDIICDEYVTAFEKEIMTYFKSFCEKCRGSTAVRFHLFLLPLDDKKRLAETLDKKLNAWQAI